MRKQGQPIPCRPSQVNGVSLEMNPVHVVVTAQPNEVPGDLVILAHGQAWQIAIQVAIDSCRRRKKSWLAAGPQKCITEHPTTYLARDSQLSKSPKGHFVKQRQRWRAPN